MKIGHCQRYNFYKVSSYIINQVFYTQTHSHSNSIDNEAHWIFVKTWKEFK